MGGKGPNSLPPFTYHLFFSLADARVASYVVRDVPRPGNAGFVVAEVVSIESVFWKEIATRIINGAHDSLLTGKRLRVLFKMEKRPGDPLIEWLTPRFFRFHFDADGLVPLALVLVKALVHWLVPVGGELVLHLRPSGEWDSLLTERADALVLYASGRDAVRGLRSHLTPRYWLLMEQLFPCCSRNDWLGQLWLRVLPPEQLTHLTRVGQRRFLVLKR